MLTRMQFINILKHTALSQTLVKQSHSAGSPVTWGSLETRELIGQQKLPCHFLYLLSRYQPWTPSHAPNYLCAKNGKKYGIAVMVTSFTLLTPQWVLPNRMVHSVGEMPSLSTGYRLVTRVLHAHLLDDDDEAFCTTCYTSLTVNQILIECPQFNNLCQQYHFGSTLIDLFNNTSVNDIIAFIKDTHFYTRI